eukprot:6772776-Alexandrium_andersonii.AAC.1
MCIRDSCSRSQPVDDRSEFEVCAARAMPARLDIDPTVPSRPDRGAQRQPRTHADTRTLQGNA